MGGYLASRLLADLAFSLAGDSSRTLRIVLSCLVLSKKEGVFEPSRNIFRHKKLVILSPVRLLGILEVSFLHEGLVPAVFSSY